MNVLIYDTEEQIGIAAGNYMCGQVLAKPNSVLGLATGSTPLKPYNHMPVRAGCCGLLQSDHF